MEVNYPGDCALALAIPLTRERFLAALAQPEERDFVFHFLKGRSLQRTEPEFCWQVYEAEEVAFVSAVCEQVAQCGVTVFHDVDLAQLTAILGRFSVVTLVAHSRFVEFVVEDIEKPFAILGSLRTPVSELHQEIRERVIKLDPDLLAGADDSVDGLRTRLCDVFRTIANEAERSYWDKEAQTNWDEESHFRARLTRSEFERAFPDAIRPARVIEFSDGLHTTPEFVQSIPIDFSGLLDLTVCNSVITAAAIRGEGRSCLVAGNRKLAELRSRMYLYGLEIELLKKEPRRFIDVIKEVHSRRNVYDNRGGTIWKPLGWLCSALWRRRQ